MLINENIGTNSSICRGFSIISIPKIKMSLYTAVLIAVNLERAADRPVRAASAATGMRTLPIRERRVLCLLECATKPEEEFLFSVLSSQLGAEPLLNSAPHCVDHTHTRNRLSFRNTGVQGSSCYLKRSLRKSVRRSG